MKEIKVIFNKEEFRIQDRNGNPWFVISDICKILKMTNSRQQAGRLPKDNVTKTYTIDSMGRKREVLITNEPGLYRLIMRSSVKQAKTFQDKVYNEILPQIRKTGKYIDTNEKSIRLKSAKKRNVFTETLKDHGINKPHEYIQLTYDTKEGLGIDKKKKKSECNIIDVLKIGLAEDLSTLNIIQDNAIGFSNVRPVVKESSKTIKSITTKKIKS